MGLRERIDDRMKAEKIAKEKSIEIMEELDICDKEHENYVEYLNNLRCALYKAMTKTLKL